MPPLEEAEEAARRDREARSLALEKTYVHDVYRQKARQFTESRHRPWPRVKQFLAELEPGSLVCDVGCGDGKYLTLNADAFFIGGDHCERLAAAAAQRTRQQVLVCDALSLPFRDESVDAAVSVAVIHHLATTERRVRALRELARVLRIGGRLIVTVWAMEQRTRKFESQDVLVPWDQSQSQSSTEQTSAIAEPEAASTASDDDLLAYHAFTHNSDSDSTRSSRFLSRRATRRPRRVRAIDPKLPSSSQSSSDLSSPSESCYSFVRRALQKLARRGEMNAGRSRPFSPWPESTDAKPDAKSTDDDQLIEIRLDDDVSALEEETASGRGTPAAGQLAAFKSHSVGDVWSLLAALRGGRRPDGSEEGRGEAGRASLPTDRPRSCPFDAVDLDSAQRRQTSARPASRKSVTFSTQSLTLPRDRPPTSDVVTAKSKSDSVLDARVRSCELLRAALSTVPENETREACEETREAGDETGEARARQKPALVRQQRCDEATRRLSELETALTDIRPGRLADKQTSLNENLIHSERVLEREKLQAEIVKQRSLNDSYLFGKLEHNEPVAQDGFLASYKRLKIIRDSLGKLSESLEKIAENEPPAASLKNGFVKMVRQWTDSGAVPGEGSEPAAPDTNSTAEPDRTEPTHSSQDACRVDDPPKVSAPSRFEPVSLPDRVEPPPPELSPKPAAATPVCSRLERRAMYRFSSRERRTSREESSDSSKENSFQSDTSLDSEDSCVSVIFVPKRETSAAENGIKPRSCSVSSESSGSSSPRSPRSLTLSGPPSPTRGPGALARMSLLKSRPKLGPQPPPANGRFPLLAPPPGRTLESSTEPTPTLSSASTVAPTPVQDQAPTSIPNSDSNPAPSQAPAQTPVPVPAPVSAPAPVPSSAPSQSVHVPPAPVPADQPTSSKIVPTEPVPSSSVDTAHSRLGCPACQLTAPSNNNSCRRSCVAPPPTPPADSVINNNVQVKLGGAAAVAGALLDRRCLRSSASLPSPRTAGPVRGDVFTAPVSALALQQSVEVVRRPGVQGLRAASRAAPAFLAFEVFHPETDDLDSDSSCASSSASSACSVLSQLADWPSSQELLELDRDIELQQLQRQQEGEQSAQDPDTGSDATSEQGRSSERYEEGEERNYKLEPAKRRRAIEDVGVQQEQREQEEKLPELDRDISVMEVQDVKMVSRAALRSQLQQDQRLADTSEVSGGGHPPSSEGVTATEIRHATDGTATAAVRPESPEFRQSPPNELISVCSVPPAPQPTDNGSDDGSAAALQSHRGLSDDHRPESRRAALSGTIDEPPLRDVPCAGSEMTLDVREQRGMAAPVGQHNVMGELDDVIRDAQQAEKGCGEVSSINMDAAGCVEAHCEAEQHVPPASARSRRKVTLARLDAPLLERVVEEAETAAVRRRPASSLSCGSEEPASLSSASSASETGRPPGLAAARASSLSSGSGTSDGRRAPNLATARTSLSSTWSSGSSMSDVLRPPSLSAGRGSLASTLSSGSSLWASEGSRAGHSHSWGSSRSTSEGATSLTEPSGAESPAGRPPADGPDSERPPAANTTLTARRIFDQAEADTAAAEVAAAAAAAAAEEGGSPGEADSQGASSEGSPRPDQGGTFGHHRYYHVFREGELDRLINKYVDNLHIISSYYDHANWCVVAEKVQVWTI